jgi:hypothetical protein
MDRKDSKELAIGMTVLCVRNTYLEELHAGKFPASATGDYSDVKVVTPYGEIPWKDLSRINQEEMRRLMREVVDKNYSVLRRLDIPEFDEELRLFGRRNAIRWDEPKDRDLLDYAAPDEEINVSH